MQLCYSVSDDALPSAAIGYGVTILGVLAGVESTREVRSRST
jgi:hypothetical protein